MITNLFEKYLVQSSFGFPAQSPTLARRKIAREIPNSIELKILFHFYEFFNALEFRIYTKCIT